MLAIYLYSPDTSILVIAKQNHLYLIHLVKCLDYLDNDLLTPVIFNCYIPKFNKV